MAETKITKVCKTCCQVFVLKNTSPSHLKRNPPKFCSRKCIRNATQFTNGHTKTPKGNKFWDNPKTKSTWFKKGILSATKPFQKGMVPWNKGLSYGVGERFRGQIMNLSKYRDWRNLAKKRDGYRCVQCGSGYPFNVDHYPKSFKEIIESNGIKTVQQAKKCEVLWDIRNARTLCIPCHKLTPTYGRPRV